MVKIQRNSSAVNISRGGLERSHWRFGLADYSAIWSNQSSDLGCSLAIRSWASIWRTERVVSSGNLAIPQHVRPSGKQDYYEHGKVSFVVRTYNKKTHSIQRRLLRQGKKAYYPTKTPSSGYHTCTKGIITAHGVVRWQSGDGGIASTQNRRNAFAVALQSW